MTRCRRAHPWNGPKGDTHTTKSAVRRGIHRTQQWDGLDRHRRL